MHLSTAVPAHVKDSTALYLKTILHLRFVSCFLLINASQAPRTAYCTGDVTPRPVCVIHWAFLPEPIFPTMAAGPSSTVEPFTPTSAPTPRCPASQRLPLTPIPNNASVESILTNLPPSLPGLPPRSSRRPGPRPRISFPKCPHRNFKPRVNELRTPTTCAMTQQPRPPPPPFVAEPRPSRAATCVPGEDGSSRQQPSRQLGPGRHP